MQHKQVNHNNRPFQRTSKSPRHLLKSIYITQVSSNNNITNPYSVFSTSRISRPPLQQSMYSQNIAFMANIADNNSSKHTVNNLNENLKYQNMQQNNISFISTKTNNQKNNQQIKFTYIPMQSFRNRSPKFANLATERIIQNSYKNKENKINKQYINLRNQYQRMQQQFKKLLHRQQKYLTKYQQLQKQTHKLKQNNIALQQQIKRIKQKLNQSTKINKINQISLDNMKKSVQIIQLMRWKTQQNNKQLNLNIQKLEFQLNMCKDQNVELGKIIGSKENQIKEVNRELEKQIKKVKEMVETNQKYQMEINNWEKKLLGFRAATQQNLLSNQTILNQQNLSTVLQQNKVLHQRIKLNQTIIHNLQSQNYTLHSTIINHDKNVQNLRILQNLVHDLNEKIVKEDLCKLSNKHKYYH